MVTAKNRSIITAHNPGESKIILEFVREGKFNGKNYKAGDTIKCTKSEARRYLAIDKSMLKILLD